MTMRERDIITAHCLTHALHEHVRLHRLILVINVQRTGGAAEERLNVDPVHCGLPLEHSAHALAHVREEDEAVGGTDAHAEGAMVIASGLSCASISSRPPAPSPFSTTFVLLPAA
eukprot:CAMPEP_0206043828 /NCGR_PEP_ID=MMETSP1466-20131121/10356_1 /ASSEMBLY_ACC=CAM_ASM_001126 /TAXON_ID=44452 /ORGANISM="Pavlova gyrans, Strain CCMP608" /LENGTH=114 /DNA_ID=CAMNT_0053418691 /DNA_START=177 /DNA_END=523 /DNA_ORIENTATION=-